MMGKNRDIIPQGWTTKKVSQVFDFLSTNSFSRNQMNYEEKEDSIYNIHYGDIHATYTEPILDLEKCKDVPVINEDVVIPTSASFLKDGDLVMADASEDYAGVGETVELTHLKDKKVLAGLHTFALRDKNGTTAKGFRTYIFKHPKVATSVKVIATGSKVYGISKTNLANVKVILPPLPEQQKIATTLSTWDKAIYKLTQIIAAKEQRKKGLMQVLLTGKKRFAGYTDEWKEVKLGDCSILSGDYGINAAGVEYNEDLPKYLRITDIDDSGLLKTESMVSVDSPDSQKYLLENEDIVFARTGASVGKHYVHNQNRYGSLVFAGFLIRFRLNKNVLLPNFLKAYLSTSEYWNWVSIMSQRSGQPGINGKEYGILKVPVPTIHEQQKIASVLSAADKEIELLKNELESLKQQKKGLMQVLLTGALRVPSV